MKKIARILRNRRGMTLVEIVAGMLIFTIIATSVTTVFVPLMRLYNRSNELAEINTLLDNLSDELLSDLAMAAAIAVDGSEITVTNVFGKVAYRVNAEGLLCRAGVPVLDKGYYKGKKVELMPVKKASGASEEEGDGEEESEEDKYIQLSNGAVTEPFYIMLTISDKDGEMASRKYAVNPLSAVFEQYKD